MKKLLSILLTVLLMLPAVMMAQTEVTVGTATTTSGQYPFYHCYEDSWSQSIYPASLINTAGTILEISFNCETAGSGSFTSMHIYMGTTSSAGSSTFIPTSQLTEVYSGTSVGVGTTTGWQTFTLTTPFAYDGQSNLVVVVSKAQSDYDCNVEYYVFSGTETYSSIIGYCDGNPACAQSPSSCSYNDYSSYLPNIKLSISTVPITCPAPTGFSVASVYDDSADLTWTEGGTESSWDLYLATSATDIPDATSTPTYTSSTTSYTLTGLTSSTNYYAYVRANCGAGDVSSWRGVSFLTSQVAAQLPYTQDFEDATENANWTLSTTGTNLWYIGTAANNTTDGEYGLYISSDNGVTNSYNISSTTNVWAYRDIDFDNIYAEYQISFDYKAYGESCCDYVKVYLGQPAEPSGASVAGATQLGGNLNVTNNWTNASFTLNSSYSGVQRLYFLWHNDGSVGTNPPGAIDNIVITGTSCGSPYNVVEGEVTTTTIPVTFTPALETDNAWEIIIVAHGDSIDETQAVAISTASYEFDNLEPATAYDIYVRTDCGTEYSFWSSVLTVRTACPEYITVPFSENFDTYGTGSTTNFPSCWNKTSTYSSGYPYISSTYSSSAPGSMYFYASGTSYTMCMLPEVDPNTPVSTLTLSFKQRASGTTSSYAMQIGVMDSTDVNSFTSVATVYPSVANTFCEQEVNFASYTGTGQTIAFKFAPGGYYNNYIDDVSLFLTPTCLRPMNVAVSQITDNSATVSWTARSGESAWSVVVVPAGDDPETGVAETATTNPYTVNGLTDNTAYDVYVKADCGGGDESPWTSAVSFTTRCLPTDVIPYVENFDTYGAGGSAYYPNCWGRMTTNTSAYPYISSTHYNGVGSLYFYSSSTTYSLATSQALDLSSYSAGSLMISFKAMRTSASYGRLDVGIMTDPSNLNTMTLLKSIYPTDYTANNVWEDFNVILNSAYESGNVYLAFLSPATGTSYVYVDTVTLGDAPTCMSPSNLEVSDIAGASARVTWTAPELTPDSYTVEYSEADQESWVTASSSVTETYYVISGLQPETEYDVRVSSNCDEGTADPVTGTFMTGCLAGGEIAIGNGTTTTTYLPVQGCYRYSLTQQLFLSSELNGSSTITGIKFYVSTTTSDTRNVTIYLGNTTQSTLSSSSYISTSNQTQVYSGNMSTATSGWVELTFSAPFAYTGGNLVLTVDDNTGSYVCTPAFQSHSSGTSLYYYNDSSNPTPSSSSPCSFSTTSTRNNVVFLGDCDETATCIAPVAHIDAVDDESITVSWVPGYTESSWEMEYKTDAESAWTSQGSVTSPVTLNGLTSNTNYSVRLRSDCGGEYSDWVTLTAHTECSSIETLPYTQNFESATGSGSSYFIDCWQRGTNSSTAYPYPSSTYKHGGNYSLYFYASSSNYCYAVTPRFDDEIDMSDLQIAFYAYKTSSSYNIEVGIMTDPSDYSTFQLVGNFSPSTTSVWELAEINTDAYTGNGHYVAFRQPQFTSNNIYIDDIDIHEIPFCGRVENIAASQITTTTATITWTPGGNEDAWEVIYGPAGTVDPATATPTAVSTTPSLDLTGLSASTAYDVYVRIDCGSGEYGAWTQANFRTACGMIDQLPYTENFDGYVASTSTRPACWSFPITYSNAPYLTTGQSYSAANSMFFQSLTTTPTTAVTPQLDLDIHTLRVKFQLKAESTSSSGTFDVGVMSDPTNTSTFESVQIIQPSNTNWNEYSVSFANTTLTGTGNYIAFRQHSQSSAWYYWLDDVTVTLIPSCAAPTNLSFDNLTSTSVDVAWTDVATESAWEIYWCPANTTPQFGDAISVSTNSYSIDQLTPATVYNVYVRTECSSGDGFSDYLIGTFTTECEPITTLPYTMNFDNMTGATSTSVTVNNLPMCWNNFNNGTQSSYTGYPIVYNSSTYALSPSNSLRYYAYSAAYGDQIAILPPVDENTYPLNTLALQFSARQNSTSYPFVVEVGVMDNPTDLTSFQLMSTFTINTATYQTHECYFDAFTGTSGRMAIRVRYASSNQPNYGYIDNVIIKLAPTCRKPMNLTVASVTSSDANLTWAGQDGNNFNIAVGNTANFDPDTCLLFFTSSTTSYQVTGLNSNTIYYVKVQSSCGSGDVSDWTDAVLFMTAANAAMVPYMTDFSDPTDNADWVIFNGSQESKWYIGTPSGATDTLLYVSNDNGATNSYSSASASYVWACRDINFGDFAEYMLDISWKCQGESSFDYMYVYIGNPAVVTPGSATAPSGAVLLSGYLNQQSASYTHFTAALNSSYANSTKRIYLMWKNDGSVYNDPAASVESISLIGSNCGRPHTLHLNDVTETTADVAFVPAASTDNAWEYAYGPAGSSVETLTPVSITDTLIQLTNLSASTAYVVYVRTDCGSGEYSEWSAALNFYTECGAVTIPYTETFDSYGAGSTSNYPQCWTRITTYGSNYPYISSTHHSGVGSLYFYTSTSGTYNIAVTPELDLTSTQMTDLQVVFQYYPSTSTAKMIVGVMTDPNNASTFVPVDTVTGATSVWTEHTVYLNSYTGTGAYVAFKNEYGTSSSYGYLDDVEIDVAPTCLKPNNLAVDATTTTSVTLSWTESGTASSWEIEYGEAGFTQGQGTIETATTNPYEVTNLTTGTTYDFYVRAVCSTADQSAWRGPVSAQPGSYNMPATGTHTVTMCGGTIYDDGGINGNYSNNCYSMLTVNPETPGMMVQLTGTYDTESSWDELTIYDGTSTSGTSLGTYSGSGNINVTSTTGSLTLVFESDGSVNYSGFALQVSCVGGGGQCDVPTNVAHNNVTHNSANITWTAGGSESAWNLQYRVQGTTAWTSVNNLTAANYAMTGLTAQTTYEVQVQAVCTDGVSVWTASHTFTTTAAPAPTCNVPTNVAHNSVTHNSANITWTAGGSETAWNLQYRAQGAATWTPVNNLTATNYAMSGLTAQTTYEVKVQAVCTDGTSDWTASHTFTTTAAPVDPCDAPTNIQVSSVTANSVVVTWTPVGNATTWEIQYKAQSAGQWQQATVQAPTHTIEGLTAGTAYDVRVRSICSSTNMSDFISTTFTTSGTGIDNVILSNSINLMPNPADNYVDLTINSNISVKEAAIYNAFGQLIQMVQLNDNHARIDLSNMASGMYFVRVAGDNTMATKKFIKK